MNKGVVTITTLGAIASIIAITGGATFAVYQTTYKGDKEVRAECLDNIIPVREKVIEQGEQISALTEALNGIYNRFDRLESGMDLLLKVQGVQTMDAQEYQDYKDGR